MNTETSPEFPRLKLRRRLVISGDGVRSVESGFSDTPTLPPHAPSGMIAAATLVESVMTANVICVREDMSIEALTSLFLDRTISGVPVVDAQGFPLGVVSKTDLLRERHENGDVFENGSSRSQRGESLDEELGIGFHTAQLSRGTVADIMTCVSINVHEHAPLSEAAALMTVAGVHRVPVVSDEGRVVGILSALDVLRWLARRDGYVVP